MPEGIRGWAIWFAAQAALTFVFRLIYKLLDSAVIDWGNSQIAAYFGIKSPSGATTFEWVLPFTLATLTLIAYHFLHNWPQSKRRARYQEKEIGLLDALWWVAEKSAWGRWQSAQRPDWSKENMRLLEASRYVRTAARNGDLMIRGRLRKSVDYADIDRDFWRSAYIDTQPDNASIWKAVIMPVGDLVIPDYDGLIVERNSVETLWPKREWKYDWRTAFLSIKAKLKSSPPHMPEVEKKEEPELASSNADTMASPVVKQAQVSTPVPVIITPSTDAPKGWEKLFAVGDDGRSIWLRFLPDTKSYRADTLVLIVYGHKIIRGATQVRMAGAHSAVNKTIDVAPARPFDNNPWARLALGIGNIFPDDYGEGCVPLYLERAGLAQGGAYQLTETGEQHARVLALDLIRRA